jgi:HlyD family secretion protein
MRQFLATIGVVNMKKKLLGILLIIALVVGVVFIWGEKQKPAAEDFLTLFGNVEIRKVDLGFRVAGRISALPFQEGERVQSGQIVARLESTPYQEELDLALAQQEQVTARLAKFEAGNRPQEITQAGALVRERQSTVKNLDLEYQRLNSLLESGAVSRQQIDDVNARLAEARARLATAKAGLTLTRNGFRSEDVDAARADLHAAQARTASARTRLDDTQCRAPDSGTILTRVKEPGAIVGAGQIVLTLSLDSPIWIRTYIEEPNLGRLYPGMGAQIFTDSRPQQPFIGHVGYISPEAEFTPKTVQTEELRTRLVYQVRIIADNSDQRLRQGMPVTIKLLEEERQRRSE